MLIRPSKGRVANKVRAVLQQLSRQLRPCKHSVPLFVIEVAAWQPPTPALCPLEVVPIVAESYDMVTCAIDSPAGILPRTVDLAVREGRLLLLLRLQCHISRLLEW